MEIPTDELQRSTPIAVPSGRQRRLLDTAEDEKSAASSAPSTSYSIHQYQVAGHFPILRHHGTICKPAWPNETAFYEHLQERCPALLVFVPKFFRTAELVLTDTVPEESMDDINVPYKSGRSTHWGQYCRTRNQKKIRLLNNQYIVLEDLTFGYHRPSILDLKIGTRQHGVGATPAKARRQQKKCDETTSRTLGLRLSGMQVWNAAEGSFLYRDKYYGRKLNDSELCNNLRSFFHNGEAYLWDCLRATIERVRKLRDAVGGMSNMRFYASSLLLLYEGRKRLPTKKLPSSFSSSSTSESEDGDSQDRVDMRLIDFAHFHWADCKSENDDAADDDSGFMFGVNSLLRILESILADQSP